MRKNITQEEQLERYKSLPKKNKDLFWEESIDNSIETLSEKFNIKDELKERLERIVLYLLLGFLPPSHIKRAIKQELLLEEEKATEFTNNFIKNIILPFIKTLNNLYDKEEFERIGLKEGILYSKRNEGPGSDDPYREPVE